MDISSLREREREREERPAQFYSYVEREREREKRIINKMWIAFALLIDLFVCSY
jgi:hypothetical protein